MMFGWGQPRPGVFRFWDGSRNRDCDPIRIHGLLEEHGGKEWPAWVDGLDKLNDPPAKFQLSASIQAARTGEAMASIRKVSDLARKVFGIKQLDDGGLTDAECITVFAGYLRYAAAVRDRYRSFRNPPPSTASGVGG